MDVARNLFKVVKTTLIEDIADKEKRKHILRTIPHMDVDTVYHSGGHDIAFMELARFGGDNWLSDTCVYLASLRVAEEATKLTWHNTTL
ncbi:hypothetical protein PI124_g16612 [Phytophthora idaei]|nr:hypothetical protein PI125_g16983 [Phytophthora idaei]KAG3140656.1 hypothetical protein PI126_g15878 [Phytophthora idaei]KAG3238428.1 hypothetical protein PI124_g16612 [Phytophthora idaei]